MSLRQILHDVPSFECEKIKTVCFFIGGHFDCDKFDLVFVMSSYLSIDLCFSISDLLAIKLKTFRFFFEPILGSNWFLQVFDCEIVLEVDEANCYLIKDSNHLI